MLAVRPEAPGDPEQPGEQRGSPHDQRGPHSAEPYEWPRWPRLSDAVRQEEADFLLDSLRSNSLSLSNYHGSLLYLENPCSAAAS